MSDENKRPDIPTLQCRVAELRNLRPEIAEILEIVEKQKVRNLKATKFETEFEAVELPEFKDPFAEPFEINVDLQAQLIDEMKKQILMMQILERKKSCPISKVMDAL